MKDEEIDKPKVFMVIGSLLFLFVAIYFIGHSDHSYERKYMLFKRTSFNSRIAFVDKDPGHYDQFKISGDSNIYNGVIIGGHNISTSFHNFVNAGDSVVKYRNSDTLIVIKRGTKYFYRYGAPNI